MTSVKLDLIHSQNLLPFFRGRITHLAQHKTCGYYKDYNADAGLIAGLAHLLL